MTYSAAPPSRGCVLVARAHNLSSERQRVDLLPKAATAGNSPTRSAAEAPCAALQHSNTERPNRSPSKNLSPSPRRCNATPSLLARFPLNVPHGTRDYGKPFIHTIQGSEESTCSRRLIEVLRTTRKQHSKQKTNRFFFGGPADYRR